MNAGICARTGRILGERRAVGMRREDGSAQVFVKVLRDETLRKQSEETMEAARKAAELANQLKDDFLATLSHELRTPLSAVLLWVKMLQANAPITNEPMLREGLAAIRNSAEAQKELIEDLLDMSRITSGQLRLQMREFALASLVRDAVEAIRPAAELKALTLAIDLAADVGAMRADPDRLRQVVWNILTNAVKFTPKSGSVTVELTRQNDEVILRVTDTGKGISPDFLPYVFDRFRQGDASHARAQGGLGLGLAIVKQLVELHGGTITADSPGQDQGATFIVRWPFAKIARKGTTRKSSGASPSRDLSRLTSRACRCWWSRTTRPPARLWD